MRLPPDPTLSWTIGLRIFHVHHAPGRQKRSRLRFVRMVGCRNQRASEATANHEHHRATTALHCFQAGRRRNKDKMAYTLGNGRRAEEDRGRNPGCKEEQTVVSLELTGRGNLDPRQLRHCAHGKSWKFDSGMCRIGRRDTVIDQLRRAHGQRFCGADIASGPKQRPVPRRLRFECKEDCQQAEANREGCAPQEWGTGEPS